VVLEEQAPPWVNSSRVPSAAWFPCSGPKPWTRVRTRLRRRQAAAPGSEVPAMSRTSFPCSMPRRWARPCRRHNAMPPPGSSRRRPYGTQTW